MLPQTAQNKILPFIPTAVYNYKARVFYNTLQQGTDNTTQHKTKQLNLLQSMYGIQPHSTSKIYILMPPKVY